MKIVTITTGNIIYLDVQNNTLKKYMKNNYEFIIINACVTKKDYSNFYKDNITENVIKFCDKYNIKFINFLKNNDDQNVYNDIQMPSHRHAYILNKLLRFLLQN